MATKKKTIPVTSVTPASKVKAVSKAQQARTRNLVMGIASATPVGRAAKVIAGSTKIAKARKAEKTAKKIATVKSKLRTINSKTLMDKASTMSPTSEGLKVRASRDVTVRVKAKPNYELAKDFSTIGKIQKQNAGGVATRAEAKANARGLRAANKPTNKVGSKADKELRSRTKSVTLNKEETATLNDYYYGMPDMVQVMSRRTPVNEARSVNKFRPTPKKKTAAQLRPKKK